MAETVDIADVVYPDADWGRVVGLAVGGSILLEGRYFRTDDRVFDENYLSVMLRNGLFQIDVRRRDDESA